VTTSRHSIVRYLLFTWLTAGGILLTLLILFYNSLKSITGSSLNPEVILGIVTLYTLLSGYAFGIAHRKRSLRLIRMLQVASVETRARLAIVGITLSLGILLGLLLSLQSISRHPVLFLVYLYGVATTVLSIWGILRVSGTTMLQVSGQWQRFFLLAATSAAIILAVLCVGRVPHVDVFDEPGEINLSWSLFTTRSFHWAMFPMKSPAEVALSYSLLNFLNGGWMKVAGLGIVQARTFYLLWGGLSIPFIYLAARQLYGTSVGLVATLIAIFLPLTHNYSRPDMFVMTMTSIGLYLFVRGRDSNRKKLYPYLTGLVVAFGMEGHLYAVRFVAAFGMIYLVEYVHHRRQSQQYSEIWYFVLGCLSFVSYYVVAHVLIVEGGQVKLSAASTIYAQEVGYSNAAKADYLNRILSDNITFYTQYFYQHTPEVLLLIVSVLAALKRKSWADRFLLANLFLSLLVGAFTLLHVNPYYWIFNMPYISILGGALIAQGRHGYSSENMPLHLSALARVGIIITMMVAYTAVTAGEDQAADHFSRIARQIDALLPREITTIIADRIYYLGIYDHRDFVTVDDFQPPIWDLAQPQPWALVLTSTAEADQLPFFVEMRRYASLTNKSRAYCFYIANYEISVYSPAEKLPEGAPIGCKAQPNLPSGH
jgi:hypothetical protein